MSQYKILFVKKNNKIDFATYKSFIISGWGWTIYGVRLYQNVTEETNATTRAFERNWIFTAIIN